MYTMHSMHRHRQFPFNGQFTKADIQLFMTEMFFFSFYKHHFEL